MICDLSKYLIMVPVLNKAANSIAEAIFENVVLIFDPIVNIRTDTEYNNKILKELFTLLDINGIPSRNGGEHRKKSQNIERIH